MALDFTAIDFETASSHHWSACAVGIAVVRDGCIVETYKRLIRPPSRHFGWYNIKVHGIDWAMVSNEPDFKEVWRELARRLSSQVLIAHNANFDRRVLKQCLRYYRIRYPLNRFVCSQTLYHEAFRFKRTNLPHLCKYLGIALRHHDPESDAKAAARLVLKAAAKLRIRTTNNLAPYFYE